MEEEKQENFGRKVKEGLALHLIDSTAMLAESTPVFAAFETGIAGMPDEISLNTRLLAAGLTYLGIGSALAKGRDAWRKLFKISETTKEKTQMLHDMAYLATFNLVVSPMMYYASGSRNLKEITIGTACAIGFGSVNGAPLGYAVDIFRDFTGTKKNDRIPNSLEKLAETMDKTSHIFPIAGYIANKTRNTAESVRKLNPRTKKAFVAFLTAGAIALTAGIYSLSSNGQNSSYETQIPKVVETQK